MSLNLAWENREVVDISVKAQLQILPVAPFPFAEGRQPLLLFAHHSTNDEIMKGAWGRKYLGDAGKGFLCVLTLLPSHSTQGSSSLGPLQHAGHRTRSAWHLLLHAAAPGCHRGRTATQGQGPIPHANLSEDTAMKVQVLRGFPQPRTRLGTPCTACSTQKPGREVLASPHLPYPHRTVTVEAGGMAGNLGWAGQRVLRLLGLAQLLPAQGSLAEQDWSQAG